MNFSGELKKHTHCVMNYLILVKTNKGIMLPLLFDFYFF